MKYWMEMQRETKFHQNLQPRVECRASLLTVPFEKKWNSKRELI